jgi:choline dehydrogenase-like flavoprotein
LHRKSSQQKLNENYKDRKLIISRTAKLVDAYAWPWVVSVSQTYAQEVVHMADTSAATQQRFPAAKATGNLTLRPFSVVHSIIYDEQQQKARGVRVIDAETKEEMEFYAKIIFVNAGALNSLLLLLNSTSSRFPNGFGKDSGRTGTLHDVS